MVWQPAAGREVFIELVGGRVLVRDNEGEFLLDL